MVGVSPPLRRVLEAMDTRDRVLDRAEATLIDVAEAALGFDPKTLTLRARVPPLAAQPNPEHLAGARAAAETLMTRTPASVDIRRTNGVYLRRWALCGADKHGAGKLYLHQLLDDDDDAPHDHPWKSRSLVLKGRLLETVYDRTGRFVRRARHDTGAVVTRAAVHTHRLERVDGAALTLFATDRKVREWGFHTAGGWVHHRDYVERTKDAPP